ncbi:YagK/YfjJ domain-containing protein [Vibrio nereis]|uniref:YagK/YfjJ domain-containing protein n=1 Tax=Vibrio nereis TaxID=693 RepID=UPI002494B80C|nr:inovirus-type Gp2 protein [Vibrio nereis]
MKYVTNNPFIKVDGEIWEVNTGSHQQHKINPKQLKQLVRQLNAMCSHYKRVFVVFFDLKVEEYTGDNAIMSAFLAQVRTLLKREYKLKRFGYCWVREVEKAKRQHYHMALFLHGRQIMFPYRLLDLLSDIWLKVGGVHLYRPDHCYYMIVANDFQIKQRVIYRLSYQAKERGKGRRDAQAKDFSTSRLKGKP